MKASNRMLVDRYERAHALVLEAITSLDDLSGEEEIHRRYMIDCVTTATASIIFTEYHQLNDRSDRSK